jgi:hypothetical protein
MAIIFIVRGRPTGHDHCLENSILLATRHLSGFTDHLLITDHLSALTGYSPLFFVTLHSSLVTLISRGIS